MAIPPDFRADGCLDEGIHDATWTEFADRFGYNLPRAVLLAQLLEFCQLLRAADGTEITLDGSFVTDKPEPKDVDVCFVTRGINDAVFTVWTKKTQKKRFPLIDIQMDDEGTYLEFFQTTRTGQPKGVVRLRLDTLPPQ